MPVPEEKRYTYALAHYRAQLLALMSAGKDLRLLEIGGGAWPKFKPGELPPTVASYTVNDIDAAALAKVPAGLKTACFDITGPVEAYAGQFDLVFSQFVAEHVRDGRRFHANVHQLLAPGGVAFHFIPTLYSSPFVLNRLLPERVTDPILKLFFPNKGDYPKFPAYYSYCRAGEGLKRSLQKIGFCEIEIRPFYGHDYYDKIPVVKQIEDAIVSLCARNDWSSYASYAYLTLRRA